ncbi:leucyl-tRNA synthetase [Emiliania huxleyi CCMP1516]|uniref:leucine--tRNA ligase n=2 Tax=Emiliania huxleyi TaxID=2903 RepID=A0A0D3KI52_EMIH1|nr:leucyl-tRNA synthetase [Emiliania huxleyi CCMP1516]EOD35437.1 leucyl-tRNA synthetase [Emiliania huxleyi CCMP1516]|eukprot:XP_005787866.1 leucyl-tRNA synthetase [Emiliania huxleyi CCMP1516]
MRTRSRRAAVSLLGLIGGAHATSLSHFRTPVFAAAGARRCMQRSFRAAAPAEAAAPPAAGASKGGVAYDLAIEAKWQAHWEAHRTFATRRREGKQKKYVLDMFPYPSGAGLHVGHPEGYTASDIMARYWRMRDYDVLHPMGWDSFGLPAEQHAMNTGTHPEVTTKENIANFKRQLRSLGFSYDWERELATTDVGYVKWTQWIFLKLFEQGLAFQDEKPVNWCAGLGTVLANEEIIDGLSERGGFPVERKPLRQWVLQITALADRLAAELDGRAGPKGTMTMQRSWIGRSEGAEIAFATEGGGEDVRVFTTRADTLMGATYVVVAPEHPLARRVGESDSAASKSDLDRTSAKAKSGVPAGESVVHPLTGERLPVWVADYVIGSYGTGAVMAVPAHDERDFDFAAAHGLPVKRVVAEPDGAAEALEEALSGGGASGGGAFTEHGVAVNSGPLVDGLATAEAKAKVSYKLRDWVFSRQRYWGEPIPIYFPVTTDGDPRKGDAYSIDYSQPLPVAEEELPVALPELEDFQPGDDPQGCLARVLDWRDAAEMQPRCEMRFFQRDGKWWARETNTMPQWAGSCWYYLRFADPANTQQAWSAEAEKAWLPVDLRGGARRAAPALRALLAQGPPLARPLLTPAVLHSLGLVSTAEPFQKLVHQGMILGADGEKMSKPAPAGNVINPDDIVSAYGADAMRLYEMFMGPLEAVKPWQTEQIAGVVRFQNRVHALATRADGSAELGDAGPHERGRTERLMHQTIKKGTGDVDALSFNTAISQMMIFSNHLAGLKQLPAEPVEKLALLVSPLAPHLGAEAWQMLGHEQSLAYEPWPEYDEAKCVETDVVMAVQVNGKVRAEIKIAKDAAEAEARELAAASENVQKFLDGKEVKKFIYVPGRIINFVAK